MRFADYLAGVVGVAAGLALGAGAATAAVGLVRRAGGIGAKNLRVRPSTLALAAVTVK